MLLSLSEKYHPRLQKDLLHKDTVSDIKKWIKQKLVEQENNNYKWILCLNGPIGSGKTTIVNNLFSAYEIIKLDSDNLRTGEKILDILRSLVGFKTRTLANIEKWNNKNVKERHNILLIDNIELCDKSISNFISLLYNQFSINIPLIVISNNQKNKDYFEDYKNCTTFIDFPKPNTKDLNKIIDTINETEFIGIKSSKIIRLRIIEKSENDIRQLFHILEQLKISLSINPDVDIEYLLDNIDSKITDVDLSEKMYSIIVKNIDFKRRFNICSSEPQLISYSIYQNYINIINNTQNKNSINDASNLIDSLSSSNVINACIYDEQNWELYDDYTFSACVLPSWLLNSQQTNQFENENQFTDILTSYKDISYNFLNSLNEVREICKNNAFCNYLQNIIGTKYKTFIENDNDIIEMYISIKNILYCIKEINGYYDKHKRGKNTTKREKFDIYNSIQENSNRHTIKCLEYICNFIYNYRIFQIDIQDILLNKNEYLDKEKRQEHVNKIDIRIFKRLLNIFSFDNGNKLLKSHTETVIQYHLFTKLIEDVHKNKNVSKSQIETLIVDIENIWNI